MPSISGSVIFDINRTATINQSDDGIENVAIVLQDKNTNKRLTVLTNSDGYFRFDNVYSGEYRLVESYGQSDFVNSPGDFSKAIIKEVPIAKDPPISAVSYKPNGSTHIDSLSQNTIELTVIDSDINDLVFLDAPVRYTPIDSLLDSCVLLKDENLISVGDVGTFGSYKPFTPINYTPKINPYANITSSKTSYVLNMNAPGQFTFRNIMTDGYINEWWNISNKTTGDETGSMMVINPFGEGNEVIFNQIINVKPNTNYLLSLWIINLVKKLDTANPQLALEVIGENGNILYDKLISDPIDPNLDVCEWIQIGSSIYSFDSSFITLKIKSYTPSWSWNDFAIDDVSFVEMIIPESIPIKSSSKSLVFEDDVFSFTTSIKNICQSPLTDVYFIDNIPTGTTFIKGSVVINDISYPNLNPSDGFNVDDVYENSTLNISFDVKVNKDALSLSNGIENISYLEYYYTPVKGGIPTVYAFDSDKVSVFLYKISTLVNMLLKFIHDCLLDIDCDNAIKSINEIMAKFVYILSSIREYIIHELRYNSSFNYGFKAQLDRFLTALDILISIGKSIRLNDICSLDLSSHVLSLILEISLSLVKVLELLQGITTYVLQCFCIGSDSYELLIGKFVNEVSCLFSLINDFKSILQYLYKLSAPQSSYVAAYVPRQQLRLPQVSSTPLRFACPPCPTPPVCPPHHISYNKCN